MLHINQRDVYEVPIGEPMRRCCCSTVSVMYEEYGAKEGEIATYYKSLLSQGFQPTQLERQKARDFISSSLKE